MRLGLLPDRRAYASEEAYGGGAAPSPAVARAIQIERRRCLAASRARITGTSTEATRPAAKPLL